jgi:SHAQKYF class myb-like DNA-binding protein
VVNDEKKKIQGAPHPKYLVALFYVIRGATVVSNFHRPRKRFVWPDTLHRDFVGAVLDIGLRGATSSSILESLQSSEAGTGWTGRLTDEQAKAHLQKYELFRDFYKKKKVICFSKRVFFANVANHLFLP